MSKKKDAKKLEALRVEYNSLNERIRQAREELGYIEYNKMAIKMNIKEMMNRQREIDKKRIKISGSELACHTPY